MISSLALLVVPGLLHAQDTFCLRNKIKVTKGWDKAYTALQLEHRTQECCFVRPVVGYRFTPWLKGDIGYEFRWKYSNDIKQRGLVSLTGTLKSGNLSVSVRERYVLEFTRRYGDSSYSSPTHLLRSMMMAKYRIPDSIFSPYLSAEAFTWKTWSKERLSAGAMLRLNEYNSLDIFYMYSVFAFKPSASQHALGINYYVTLR